MSSGEDSRSVFEGLKLVANNSFNTIIHLPLFIVGWEDYFGKV
jgi:hypothetical protein